MTSLFSCFLILFSLLLAGQTVRGSASLDENAGKGDYVILLHGQARTSFSMLWLEFRLRREGYRVINRSYPSMRLSVEELSDQWLEQLLKTAVHDHAVRIHFVTHSLGGILLRQYLANHHIENLGNVVMLAPPNQGSRIIDKLAANPFSRRLLGSARLRLGTGSESLPKRLGPVGFDVGVIAGDRSLNPVLSAMLDGPNDGKVTVASAKVAGMKDFLIVHSTHTWLMCRSQTLRQTVHFLKTGRFDHGIDGRG